MGFFGLYAAKNGFLPQMERETMRNMRGETKSFKIKALTSKMVL